METPEIITFDGLEDKDRDLDELIVITNADGGNKYRYTAMRYCLDDRCKAKKAYSIDASNCRIAAMQLRKNAAFWGNKEKNPFVQYVVSYLNETAASVAEAMRFTLAIFEPIIEGHMALTVGHNEDHQTAGFHTHTFVDTTDYTDGTMLYSDNKTNCEIAQRVANVIRKPVKLIIKYHSKDKGWTFPKIFTPQDDVEET